MNLLISKLDLSLQPRVTLNDETVEEYKEHLADGKVFPPVTVYDTDGVLSLVDGFHRVAALTRLGKEEVEANVIKGTYAEALKASLSMNDKHGLRRTNADKRRCLEIALENKDILFPTLDGKDENGKPNGLPSSRQLVKITGVSQRTAVNFIAESRVSNLLTPTAKDATTPTKEHLEERNPDVRKLLTEGKDRYGVAIPEKLLPAFRSTKVKKLLRELKAKRNTVREGISEGALEFALMGSDSLALFDRVISVMQYWAIWCVCRACGGKGCPKCGYHGVQTKAQYEMNPRELKVETK